LKTTEVELSGLTYTLLEMLVWPAFGHAWRLRR